MKADFLQECLTDLSAKVKKSIPIDQFNNEYCIYCQNRDCSRSGAENRLFNVRASNWKSTLFDNVPRALPNDPSYESIRSKWFKPPQVVINPQPDPPKTDESQAVPPPSSAETIPEIVKDRVEEPLDQNEETLPEPPQISESTTKKVINNQNTSWDAEEYIEEKKDQDVVISPGGSFTFGR